MTLVIKKPTGGKLIMRKSWQPMDPDAATYIAAVEAADGQALEEKTKIAIDNFVLGCKADGIWSAIKASCILAGARTLNGALVPLVGAAPTNFNFVAGDYNRKTGIQGGDAGKYISTGVDNSDSLYGTQNNKHVALYVPLTTANFTRAYIAGGSTAIRVATSLSTFLGLALNSAALNVSNTHVTNSTDFPFMGVSRNDGVEFNYRARGQNGRSSNRASSTPTGGTFVLFWDSATTYTTCKIAFYSIGESLNLALLDARVADLINAFATAIP